MAAPGALGPWSLSSSAWQNNTPLPGCLRSCFPGLPGLLVRCRHLGLMNAPQSLGLALVRITVVFMTVSDLPQLTESLCPASMLEEPNNCSGAREQLGGVAGREWGCPGYEGGAALPSWGTERKQLRSGSPGAKGPDGFRMTGGVWGLWRLWGGQLLQLQSLPQKLPGVVSPSCSQPLGPCSPAPGSWLICCCRELCGAPDRTWILSPGFFLGEG